MEGIDRDLVEGKFRQLRRLVVQFSPFLLNIILGSRWSVAKFSASVSMVTAPTLNPVSSVTSLSNTGFVSVLLRLVLI
jgi:hypothetical protein